MLIRTKEQQDETCRQTVGNLFFPLFRWSPVQWRSWGKKYKLALKRLWTFASNMTSIGQVWKDPASQLTILYSTLNFRIRIHKAYRMVLSNGERNQPRSTVANVETWTCSVEQPRSGGLQLSVCTWTTREESTRRRKKSAFKVVALFLPDALFFQDKGGVVDALYRNKSTLEAIFHIMDADHSGRRRLSKVVGMFFSYSYFARKKSKHSVAWCHLVALLQSWAKWGYFFFIFDGTINLIRQ